MTMPGFTAEASLVKTSSRYRSEGAWFRRDGGSAASQIVASYIQRCPPGYLYRCQWVYIGGYERYWQCGCFRNYTVAFPVG